MQVSGPVKSSYQAPNAIRPDNIAGRQTTPGNKSRSLAAFARKGAVLGIGPLVVVLGMATVARAEFIAIVNPSFELPAVADGDYTTGMIPGWSAPGSAGVFNSITGVHYSGLGATDGVQSAYLDAGQISQILDETLSVGLYTLRVDVGGRLDDRNGVGIYTVGLWAGDALLAERDPSPNPFNDFLTSTLQFLALPGDPRLGQFLAIRLTKVSGGQVNFDNVQLERLGEAQPVPEPSSLCLLGTGALAVVLMRRRRLQRALGDSIGV